MTLIKLGLFTLVGIILLRNIGKAMDTEVVLFEIPGQNIRARLLHESKKTDRLVLSIPGGPGISGTYMDTYTASLAKHLHATGLTIDLPNHGLSCRSLTCGKFDYDDARKAIIGFIKELQKHHRRIVLVGHSFGALIALDMLQESGLGFEKTILVSMPSSFDGNARFTEFRSTNGLLQENWIAESDFQVWWRKLAPFYFHRDASAHQLDQLTKQTYWIGNENFGSGMPTFEELTSKLGARGSEYSILYVEGDHEPILPDDNFQRVIDAIPKARHLKVENSGHFPMLENLGKLTAESVSWFNQCNAFPKGEKR